MRGLACNACNVEFENEAAQKFHYQCEWHRYNLKRKITGVPGVTEGLFNLRLEALAAEKKRTEADRLLYKCALCGKEYTTEKAHLQHLRSKLHITKASSRPDSPDVGVAIVRPAPTRTPREQSDVQKKGSPMMDSDEDDEADDSDDDWEEVDPDDDVMEGEAVDDEVAEASPEQVAEDEWDATRCFICDLQPDKTIQGCVEHMHKIHGFFIPDIEYLKDAKGMLNYLGLKVTKGFMCLYCDEKGKRFQSVEAVRKHMISKSHCKLHYGDSEGGDEEELEEFYDFSSSYVSADGAQLVPADADGQSAPVEFIQGSELVLWGGQSPKTIQSRESFQYYRYRLKYRLNHRASNWSDGIMMRAYFSRLQSRPNPIRNMVASRKLPAARLEAFRTKVGTKNNVIWNLPKNVPY